MALLQRVMAWSLFQVKKKPVGSECRVDIWGVCMGDPSTVQCSHTPDTSTLAEMLRDVRHTRRELRRLGAGEHLRCHRQLDRAAVSGHPAGLHRDFLVHHCVGLLPCLHTWTVSFQYFFSPRPPPHHLQPPGGARRHPEAPGG